MWPGSRVGAAANENLLVLDHEIRVNEHALAVARARRRNSDRLVVATCGLLVLLYGIWWLPWPTGVARWAIVVAAAVLAIGCAGSAINLKRRPGGPADAGKGRIGEAQLELDLSQRKDRRKYLLAAGGPEVAVRRAAYRDDARAEIEQLRRESRRYRSVNNLLQGILIIGSLLATTVAGIADEMTIDRWILMATTFLVGVASGFMGYFKYKERSFYLQQTADAIEHESDAVEIGVGRYKSLGDDEALAEYVAEVHRLKSEQKKREQNLEQPPEVRAALHQ